MPFTISHAAAALPFLHSRLNFTALIIGTMSPDFEYILMFGFSRNVSHSLLGLLLFCIPAGLLFYALYRWLWLKVLINLAPESFRRRLTHDGTNPRNYSVGNTVLSIFIGAVSHDLLDAFTHDNGWGTVLCPWLAERVPFFPLRYGELSFVIISLLGLLLLFIVAMRWYVKTPEQSHCPLREQLFFPFFPLIVVICGMVFIAGFTWLRQGAYTVYRLKFMVANATLGLLIYVTLLLTATGLAVYLLQRRNDSR